MRRFLLFYGMRRIFTLYDKGNEKEANMGFNKNINKETMNILLQENKRLRRECRRLNESLEELQEYKEEYKKLISELNQIKETYLEKIKGFEKLEDGYKKEFNRMINQRKTRR